MTDDEKVSTDSANLLRPGEGPKTGKFAVLERGVTGREIVELWIRELQEAADAEKAKKEKK